MASTEAETYADGKFRAWCTVFAAFCLSLGGSGVISSFGVFQAFYTTKFLSHTSASAISWIGSLQLALMLLLGPLAGQLLYGGHIKLLLIGGCSINVFSFFMLSLVQPGKYYQAFLSQGLGMGIGVGLFYMPCLAVVGKHFKRKRALAMGIVASSVAVGGGLFSIMFNLLFNGRVGFAWGVRIGAFIVLGLYITGILLFFEPRPLQSRPLPLSERSTDAITERAADAPKDGDAPALAVGKVQKSPLLSASETPKTAALLDKQFLLVILGGWLVSLGDYVPPFYVQLFVELHGGNATLAFYSLAMVNFAAAFGRIIPSMLADRFGLLNVIIPVWFLNGVLAFAMLGATNTAGVVLFSIFYGFFFGAGVALYLPLVAYMSLKQGVDIGKRMGLATVPLGVSCLIGPPLTGKIVGPNFIWWKGMTFAAVVMIASVVPVIVIWIADRRVLRRGANPGTGVYER